MLPTPGLTSIGSLQLPHLPPTPSGPNPSGPGAFNTAYDRIQTVGDQMHHGVAPVQPQLPTSMEVRPLMSPATSLSQAWTPSVEFPGAINPDGMKLPGAAKPRPVTPGTSADKPGEGPLGFLEPLKGAVSDATKLQGKADDLAAEAAVGGDVDLHDVMISAEKAGVALNLTLQIRNRLVDAYQEVMRMQV
jgi:flagellar hook-basal body complex protein FliE